MVMVKGEISMLLYAIGLNFLEFGKLHYDIIIYAVVKKALNNYQT